MTDKTGTEDDDAPYIGEHDSFPYEFAESKRSNTKFRIYTTVTLNSMLKGHLIDGINKNMKVDNVKKIIYDWLKTENTFDDILKDKEDLEIYLFLPLGIPFLSGTFKEWESCFKTIFRKTLYVIVTRKLNDTASKLYKYVCNCKSNEMKKLLSPLCDSTPEGYCQISSLLGYLYYGGSLPSSENLLRNLATMTGFAPMINSMYTLMMQKKFNGLTIASITAPLQTFICEKVIGSNLETAFSYTIALMSYVNKTKIINLPIPNFTTYTFKNDDDEYELNKVQEYLKNHDHLNYVVTWDMISFKVSKLPEPITINQLNDSFKTEISFKPVSPMAILYLYSVSFIKLEKPKDTNTPVKIGLFIRKKPTKECERNIEFIDPEKEEPEEMDYEQLADNIGDHTIDEDVENKGNYTLQQSIVVCFDISLSMKNLLNGKAKRNRSKDPSRKELSISFLKSLMKLIHEYKVPTARGLILFGKEIEIKCPLSIKESDFNNAVENIMTYGTTPLWNAVNIAADELIKFNPYQVINDKKIYKYPEAQNRIILISDTNDTESNNEEIYKTAEKLVENGIVLDVIMVSSIEECRNALVTSKITGGLAFKPENKDQGIEFFANEAFLNIKARSNCKPIENSITEDLFNQINQEIGNNPYTNSKEIENQFIKDAMINENLSTAEYALFDRIDEKKQPKTICDRYILRQLNRVYKMDDPNIVVYVFQKDIKKWRVFIKGMEGTPYSDVWWSLFVKFPPNYPNSPPHFRFISIPYHQNVSNEGKLLFSKIADYYDAQEKMPLILQSIRNLFKEPDDLYCLRENLLEERNNDIDAFNKKAEVLKKECAKEDYHDYIKESKIYGENNINQDGNYFDDESSLFVTLQKNDGNIKIIINSDDENEGIDV